MAKVSQPVWSDMTIEKAVREGYKKSGWVYRAVRLIGTSVSSVPWVVYDDSGAPVPEHPISILMKNPNPRISRQTLIDLVNSWLQLTGNAYLIPIKVNGKTTELWPCSPDRLKPIPTDDPTEWVKGYALDDSSSVNYTQDEVIHFLFSDPANPIIGIGPLQAASRAVDVDLEQQSWQKGALQNKGVLDGVFSFKREFKKLEDLEEVTQKLNEKFTGASGKRIGAIGSEATYTRVAATPAEMDSLNGRKFSREEIFIIFGVPPQLAGSQESSSYNNYQTSELVFWMNTVVGLLDDLKDTLNFSLADELQDGYTLGYDLSGVPAIRRAQLETVKSGKMLSEMGVPVERINKILNLNIEEYDGWDKSNVSSQQGQTKEPSEDKEDENRCLFMTKTIEQRMDPQQEAEARELESIERSSVYADILAQQQDDVFHAIDTGGDIQAAVEKTRRDWIKALTDNYVNTAIVWGDEIIISTRAFEDDLEQAVSKYIAEEGIILTELSFIDMTTVDAIALQISDALEQGLPISASQQALLDMGIFSAERALRISRTVTGAAASLGQLTAGELSGAQQKVWQTSGFGTRAGHSAREGETVGIKDRFSIQYGSTVGPLFPGDPKISAGDRINCRCSLTFL